LLNIGVLVPVNKKKIRFTSCIILRVCLQAVWPRPENRLSEGVLRTPIDLIKYGLQHVTPRTIACELVKNKDGPAEASFQAALYAAFNGLLPTGMMCLFEVKAKSQDKLDLLVIKHNEKWAGYELKFNKISRADFNGPVTQAGKYAEHFRINIHLPDTSSTPVFPDTAANIIVVNVKCNKDCSQFNIDSSNSNGPKNEFINNLLSNSK
ncbi:13946_t:CDS:1, partial [Funneliformis geosporum]